MMKADEMRAGSVLQQAVAAGGAEDERLAAEHASLLDRIAVLEAQAKRLHAQAVQLEALRKLGSWDVDVATGTLTWSDGTYRIFGLPSGDPVTVERALSFYPEEARTAISVGLEAAALSGTPYDLTVPFMNASGHKGWVRTIGQWHNTGGMRRIVGIIEDVTAEKEAQDRLRDLVYRDALTDLPNRRAFEARLAQVEHSPEPLAAALILLDVDNFKAVNDTFGHPVGDLLLREIASRLQRCIRPTDVVARLGGDEFGILLFDVSHPDGLEQRASQILAAVRQAVRTDGGALCPTASIGVCHSTAATVDDGLFKCADVALYRAKALGRDRAEIFRGELRRKADRDAQMLNAVRQAIERDQLIVFYQPIVDLRTSQVRGLEALVRWDHPEQGILPPAAFASALEDPVLSVAIDDFVLRRALRQMKEWMDEGVPVAAVNVNASAAQLRRSDLVDRIRELLALNGLTPDRLKIELVETAFLSRDAHQIATTIERLAELGVVCALDDFGTGHASLTHLRQFRAERIKIDRSFIANICTEPFDRGLVKSLVDLGRNLGIRITAEGVETAEQLALLRAFGCDCAQGYLIGRPAPAAQIPDLIVRWYASQAAAERLDRSSAVNGGAIAGQSWSGPFGMDEIRLVS